MSNTSEVGTGGNLAQIHQLRHEPEGPDTTEAIHRAIDQCLITMVYQPIVDLKTGAVFAYEALCRSRLPQFEGPEALIQAATSVGRIGELGRLQRRLASKNCADYPIFVNISPHEFDDVYLVRPDDAIFGHRHPVFIEITESVPLVFFDQCHSVLAELRRKGARLAIDDLGAGYSNLKYIADLAPDIVKLDRELVAGCTREGAQYKLLCSIAQLCREVDAKVVAEGVENAEELDAVTSAGIELCQGFFLGRPKSSPPEVCWPAADILSTRASVAELVARRRAQRAPASSEEEERRIAQMEELSCTLEKSVRKARGEVVRLRKALDRAEDKTQKAHNRLSQVESSLAQSEIERQRLSRMFESREAEDPAPPEPPPPTVEPPAAPTPPRSRTGRSLALQGLIWVTGLLAGLALYQFDPRAEGPQASQMSETTVATAGAAPMAARPSEPAPAAPKMEPATLPAPAAEPAGEAVTAPPEISELATAPVDAPSEPTAVEPLAVEPEPISEERLQEQVVERVQSWVTAWSAQDVDGYLDSYAHDFVSESGVGGEAWRVQRRERLAAPSFIEVELDDLDIEIQGPDAATATFVQIYRSDSFGDQMRKRLELRRDAAGAWRIDTEGPAS